jgi:hypothetical protein
MASTNHVCDLLDVFNKYIYIYIHVEILGHRGGGVPIEHPLRHRVEAVEACKKLRIQFHDYHYHKSQRY